MGLAAMRAPAEVSVVAVPAGLLASGSYSWRPGDALLVVSSSGELRDIVELLNDAQPGLPPFALVTATATSSLAGRAAAVRLVPVREQRAVTHTQAFVGNVLSLLLLWQDLAGHDLGLEVARLPDLCAGAIRKSSEWAAGLDLAYPQAATAFGMGGGWPAALEAALLLKEVSGVPAEGMETREGATSGMYALRQGHLVVSLPTPGDRYLEEAEATCRATGANVVRLPAPDYPTDLLAPVLTFPAAVALAARLGTDAGRDVDSPHWGAAYYTTARVQPSRTPVANPGHSSTTPTAAPHQRPLHHSHKTPEEHL